ncbi:MAG: hypothetical protein P8X57_01345 [Cyclobacteriaceae bacterium]
MTGCSIDKDKAVDRERFTFKIGDDTLLFFKNIRQSDYDLEDNEAAKLRVYRHEKRPVDDSIPYLSPAIVISILRDEAYILLEPSTILMDEDTLQVALVKDAAADTISIQTMNRENNLEFASRLYEHLQQAGSFYIRVNGKFEPFLTDNEIRESFRVTLADYYRLTRIY